jgi:endonuclease YncB( thermonuclease family)
VNATPRRAAVGALAYLILVSASLVVSAAGVAGETQRSETAVVASIYDSDTLSLRDGRRVRLVQIDTPELGSGECYSRAARTVLLSLAPIGRPVVLEIDPALDRTDRYGRILRYVKPNGVNVNVELVRRGAAAPYFYRSDRGRYAATLMRAARAQGLRGLGSGMHAPRPSFAPNAQSRPGGADHRLGRRPQPASAIRITPVAAFRRIRRISTALTFALSG